MAMVWTSVRAEPETYKGLTSNHHHFFRILVWTNVSGIILPQRLFRLGQNFRIYFRSFLPYSKIDFYQAKKQKIVSEAQNPRYEFKVFSLPMSSASDEQEFFDHLAQICAFKYNLRFLPNTHLLEKAIIAFRLNTAFSVNRLLLPFYEIH